MVKMIKDHIKFMGKLIVYLGQVSAIIGLIIGVITNNSIYLTIGYSGLVAVIGGCAMHEYSEEA
jgi:hypothetical protein